MQKVLVTGSNGQLGSEFKFLADRYSNLEFIFTDSTSLNIVNKAEIEKFFAGNKIDFCINCAAYTAVDKAETERELCYTINTEAVSNIALECAKQGSTLIHFSTDYVFNGQNYKPYTEEDLADPINYYGQTKLEGEQKALENNQKTLVFRTSWVHSSFGKNFVKTITKLASERDELNIIFDQIGTPTYARDLAENILEIISKQDLDGKYGIYNFSNEGVTSWYDFAKVIAKQAGLGCKINPIESKDYPTAAKRPFYSVLNKAKFKQNFGLEIGYWKEKVDIK